ncbi:unnamed protein product [Toxocara canis]|uniref:EHD_N domain-containing protein n=1 Tax=Toxocara canis TaxID=6265 RepID=A0A183V658_TOXCA|nr:unnamed protein product [Toxocara canis]
MCKPKKAVIPNAGNADAIKALKIAYDEKVKPTEIRHLYASFDTPPIRDPELFPEDSPINRSVNATDCFLWTFARDSQEEEARRNERESTEGMRGKKTMKEGEEGMERR